MATYYSNDFRSGLKIMLDGEPYAVESSEFVKPGKGQAFARVKLRRLLTGTRVENLQIDRFRRRRGCSRYEPDLPVQRR